MHKVSGSCNHSKRNPVECDEGGAVSQVRAWLCQSSRGRRGSSVTKRHDREQDKRTRSMDRRRIAPPDGPGGGRACRPVTGDLGTEERTTSGTARCARRDLETRGHLRGTLGAYEPAESGTLHLILARVRSGSRGVGFECGMVPRRAMAVEEHVPRRETYIHGSRLAMGRRVKGTNWSCSSRK